MKLKIMAASQFVLIIALVIFLLTRFVTLDESGPIVREHASPSESSLEYTPLRPALSEKPPG